MIKDFINNNLRISGITINQLSRLSGLVNSYIIKLQNGELKNPGRDKLIKIGLALNCDFNKINKLLKCLNHKKLSEFDISQFINYVEEKEYVPSRKELNKKKPRQSIKVNDPIVIDPINYNLSFLSLEKNYGNEIFIANNISDLFFDERGLFGDPEEKRINENLDDKDIYLYILKNIFIERKKKFNENLKKHKSEHYIPIDKILQYTNHLNRKTNRIDKEVIKQFENLFDYMYKYPNFRFLITNQSIILNTYIKNIKNSSDVVIYHGNNNNMINYNKNINKSSLIGFVSNSKELSNCFLSDYENIKDSIIKECGSIKRTIKLIEKLIMQ